MIISTNPIAGTTILADWGTDVVTDLNSLDSDIGDLEADIAGLEAAWISFTPTWTTSGTAPSLGNGTLTGKYRQVGKTIQFRVRFVPGSTTTFGTGNYFFALPPFASVSLGSFDLPTEGSGVAVDVSTQVRYRIIPTINTTTVVWLNTGDNNPGVVQATAPATWANGDSFNFGGTYEAA